MTDSGIPILKSIDVRPDFSGGVCNNIKTIKNLTSNNLFYWYSPLQQPLKPTVDIQFISSPNDKNLKFKTALTIPGMSNSELIDAMPCIEPVMQTKDGQNFTPNGAMGIDMSKGQITNDWIWDKETPPNGLLFNREIKVITN